MKTKLLRDKGWVQLVLTEPNPEVLYDKGVVSGMTEDEGTGCWIIADIRLGRYMTANPYAGSISAEDFVSMHKPASGDERELYLSRLREVDEREDGTLLWCSYNGIVRGSQSVSGYTPSRWMDFTPNVYHSYREGLAIMKEIRAFWNNYIGRIKDAKIDNPYYQPTASAISSELIMQRVIQEHKAKVTTWTPEP
jgi:hypothetical protein